MNAIRPIAALLAAVLAVSALSSCDSKEPNQSSSENATLKWIQIGGQPNDLDAVTKELNRYSSEKIGVQCSFTYLDWGIFGDRVKAILNSGEPFDILFNNGDYYAPAISLGAFADLTGMLEETPSLRDFIPESVWSGVTVNGKIYAVPTYKDSSQTQYWVWDQEIVDRYQIDYEAIRTCADLDAPLRTIQDAINRGEITGTQYAFYNIRDGINGMFMNYDVNICQLGVRIDDPNARVVRVLEQPDIQETLTYMHQWYQDGIINPDAPTITEMPKWVPVSSAQGYPGSEVTWATQRGKPVAVQPWAGPVYSTGSIMGSVNSISSASKYQKEALKYLELCNTDETMRNLLGNGIEGVHYTDNGDGTITYDPARHDDYAPALYSQATFFTLKPVAPNLPSQWDKVRDWNESAKESVLLGFTFDRSRVENELAACAAVADRFNYELYTGASDPAVKIPEYYAALEKAGLSKIEEELQRQVYAFLDR